MPPRNVRKRRTSSDDESEEESTSNVQEAKLIQSFKKRRHGLDMAALMVVNTVDEEHTTTKVSEDPYNITSGGIVDIEYLKRLAAGAADADLTEDDKVAVSSFAPDSADVLEEKRMQKYVELEMAKRKGTASELESPEKPPTATSILDSLYELPDELKKVKGKQRNEEYLSNEMLTGIPEVDLGIDSKIRNIEDTEAAKQLALRQRREAALNAADQHAQAAVPSNIAVNFVQHNRWSGQLDSWNTRLEANKKKSMAMSAETPAGGNLLTPTVLKAKK